MRRKAEGKSPLSPHFEHLPAPTCGHFQARAASCGGGETGDVAVTFQGALKPALGEEPSSGASVGDELPAGTALCGGQYTIERFLNAGGFGITYLARDSLDRRVVIKECFPAVLCRRQGLSVQLRADRYMQDFTYLLGLFKREAQALARLKEDWILSGATLSRDALLERL